MGHILYDTIYSDQLARRINDETEFKCNQTESIYWEINAKAWATNNWLTRNRERNWISLKIRFANESFDRKLNEKFRFYWILRQIHLVTIAENFGGFLLLLNLTMCSRWIFKKEFNFCEKEKQNWNEKNFLTKFLSFSLESVAKTPDSK